MATMFIYFEHEEEAVKGSNVSNVHFTEIPARKLKISSLKDRTAAVHAVMNVARSRLGLRVSGDSTVGIMTVVYDTDKWISQQKAIEIVSDAIEMSQQNLTPPRSTPRTTPLDTKKKGRR